MTGGHINLKLQGLVYLAQYRSAEDGDLLQFFGKTLAGVERDSTFDRIYTRIARDWRERDEIVTPFTSRRWAGIETVWTFDLDDDILQLDKRDCNLWVSLSLVRQRSIDDSDFKPYDPPPYNTQPLTKWFTQSIHHARRWKMRRNGLDLARLQRRKVFVSRILADLSSQWKHVLCGRYNDFTFRKLAYAVVRIIILNFNVQETTVARQGIGGFLVWINDLPKWGFVNEHIVRVGQTPIVICRHAPHAITLIRNDFAQQAPTNRASFAKGLTYLILSLREVLLYHASSERDRYTEPKRLFDGTNPPSDEAIELLLQATQTNAITVPVLHSLPVELQDAILDKVSAGPIESARMGCLLDLGSAFQWKCGNRKIEKEEGRRHRTPWTPVESQIYFGDYPSGVAYK